MGLSLLLTTKIDQKQDYLTSIEYRSYEHGLHLDTVDLDKTIWIKAIDDDCYRF